MALPASVLHSCVTTTSLVSSASVSDCFAGANASSVSVRRDSPVDVTGAATPSISKAKTPPVANYLFVPGDTPDIDDEDEEEFLKKDIEVDQSSTSIDSSLTELQVDESTTTIDSAFSQFQQIANQSTEVSTRLQDAA